MSIKSLSAHWNELGLMGGGWAWFGEAKAILLIWYKLFKNEIFWNENY